MTKSYSALPKMGNNGGTAFVRINGKRIYLGKFGTPKAIQNYAREIAEWAASNTTLRKPMMPIGMITVDTLVVAFLKHVQKISPSHYHSCRTAANILLELYSGLLVGDFTPKCLAAVQHRFTQQTSKKGTLYSRQYCNALVNYTKRMFRWGVAQELVSPKTADALKYVPAIQKGCIESPETKPREDVSDDVVKASLPYLLPTVATMVQVQRLAVMRPNEVCRMHVGDIDRTRKDGIWIYTPPEHKGAWRGHERVIPLGKPEQALILPYLEGKSPKQAVFSPKTAMLEKKARDAKRRKTKMYPSQIQRATRYAANPKRKTREHYSSVSYAQSIRRAIEAANRSLSEDQKISHWTPYQLRHAGVTELVYENDGNLDIARAVAGQKSIIVTQRYNHADLHIAIEQAKQRGKRKEMTCVSNVMTTATANDLSIILRNSNQQTFVVPSAFIGFAAKSMPEMRKPASAFTNTEQVIRLCPIWIDADTKSWHRLLLD